MRTLITGGAGFIGSALCRALLTQSDDEVTVVDKLTYAGDIRTLEASNTSPRFSFHQADICDRAALDAIFAEARPDRVFHLAAETHVDRSIDGAQTFIETNINGTFNVLEACRAHWRSLKPEEADVFRLLHISTDEVFGSLGPDGHFDETTAYDPSSPYSASKAASDHLVRAWHRTYGLPVLVTNCSNNYGPYQYPEKLIPLMIAKAMNGEKLPVFGDGANIRDWLHVDDHVAALLQVSEQGTLGETYAIGGNAERTNLDVVKTICSHLDVAHQDGAPHDVLINFVTDRPGHDRRYAIDASKLRTELGWTPHHTFETGLKDTIDWYLAHREWWQGAIAAGADKRAGLSTS